MTNSTTSGSGLASLATYVDENMPGGIPAGAKAACHGAAAFAEALGDRAGEFIKAAKELADRNELTTEEAGALSQVESSVAAKAPGAAKAKLTMKEIEELERHGANLYRGVRGDAVPRHRESDYLFTQLKRFVDSGASDFFLETQKAKGLIWFKIVFKIDGVQEVQDMSAPARPDDDSRENDNLFFQRVRKYLGAELSRINADMKHTMQDGSFSLTYKGKSRDFRVNALPCRAYGEAHPRYAIRLASEGDAVDFDSIEMLPVTKREYDNIISGKISGCVVVTGPTGSGKTTTIYAMLNKVDKERNGVVSIEKPIESQLMDVNQTEDDIRERDDRKERYGNTEFLKGILRQAADVIFVGEMRSGDEIKEGIRVGLTGSKVITTLHANNCVDTLLRLKEEGLTNNAIANGVKYVTAQRLVPALCPACCVPHKNPAKMLEKIEAAFRRPARHFVKHLSEELTDLEMKDLLDGAEVAEALLRSKKLHISEDDAEAVATEVDKAFHLLEKMKDKDSRVSHIVSQCADRFPNHGAMAEFSARFDEGKLMSANLKGCQECRGGYKGRVGIFEVLSMDKAMRRFVQDPSNKLVDVEDFLQSKGFLGMRKYGWLLALEGKVDPDDVVSLVE